MLIWDKPDERYFYHGIDRGVLYPSDSDPVAWNGISGLDEKGNAESYILYRDGRVYLADADPGDFEGTLKAFFFPDAFAECLGIPEATDGLYVDNQKPQRFGLSYRSLIGSGTQGDMFGYQIHLVYNAVASIQGRSRKTLTKNRDPEELTFEIVATPVQLTGFRPSAHYILDTRHLGSSTVAQLEELLYGSSSEPGRLPTPQELYDMMNFGSSITFTSWVHPVLGDCWTARGAYANVHMTSPTTWEILNVNGIDHGDGTYTLQDTP